MTTSAASVIQAIVSEAERVGVSPRTAIATAVVESGLNPRAVGAGSYGLFQLQNGGELGSLPGSLHTRISEAFNPATNAGVALPVFAAVQKAHPGLNPGELAAAAQRPANPSAYAAKVNQVYAQLGAVKALSSSAPIGAHLASYSPGAKTGSHAGFWSGLASDIGRVLRGAVAFDASGGSPAAAAKASAPAGSSPSSGGILGGIGSGVVHGIDTGLLGVGITVALVLGAIALVVLGASRLFPGSTRAVEGAVP